MWRHVFKNRWIAIAWVGLICWQAADFVAPPPKDEPATAAPAVSADDIAKVEALLKAR